MDGLEDGLFLAEVSSFGERRGSALRVRIGSNGREEGVVEKREGRGEVTPKVLDPGRQLGQPRDQT